MDTLKSLKSLFRYKKENHRPDIAGKNIVLVGYDNESLIRYIRDYLASKNVFVASTNKVDSVVFDDGERMLPCVMNQIEELDPIIDGVNSTSNYTYSLIRVQYHSNIVQPVMYKQSKISNDLSVVVYGHDDYDDVYQAILEDTYSDHIRGVYYFINRNIPESVTYEIHRGIIDCLPHVDIKFRPRAFNIIVYSLADFDDRKNFYDNQAKLKKHGMKIRLEGSQSITSLRNIKELNRMKLLDPTILSKCYRVDYGMGLIGQYIEDV